MEITNILLHCLQFGVQAMNNEGEYKSKICVTSKSNVTFFQTNGSIDFFEKLCPVNTSHKCHFETQLVSERVRNVVSCV